MSRHNEDTHQITTTLLSLLFVLLPENSNFLPRDTTYKRVGLGFFWQNLVSAKHEV